MPDEELWRALLDGRKKGVFYNAFRALLAGLASLYSLGLAAYLASEKIGIRRRMKAPVPVISIGNLAVGGTGKTPMAQLVARHLMGMGCRVAILSRGYRGAREGAEAVVSDGEGNVLLSEAEAGDEATLLAQSLPDVPVLIGRDRRRTARLATERFAPNLLILDDGLQYWQLARDLDIVLLDAARPFDNGYPLPRGLLREPKGNIRRAGVIVITRADSLSSDGRASLLGELGRLVPGAPVFFSCHKAAGWYPLDPLTVGPPAEALAVCAIAQPQSFISSLQSMGISIAGTLTFPDHARYGPCEKAQIAGKIKECGARCLVITQKDAVKMPSGFTSLPIFVLRTELQIEDEPGFWQAVEKRVGSIAARSSALEK